MYKFLDTKQTKPWFMFSSREDKKIGISDRINRCGVVLCDLLLSIISVVVYVFSLLFVFPLNKMRVKYTPIICDLIRKSDESRESSADYHFRFYSDGQVVLINENSEKTVFRMPHNEINDIVNVIKKNKIYKGDIGDFSVEYADADNYYLYIVLFNKKKRVVVKAGGYNPDDNSFCEASDYLIKYIKRYTGDKLINSNKDWYMY